MKVIGAGFPRNGTLSTKAALELLGHNCYHMTVVPQEKGHADAWYNTIVEGKDMDWHTLYKNFGATVDAPSCFYYKEIMEAYPDAKVLLNVRDPERWYASFKVLTDTVYSFAWVGKLVPKYKKMLTITDHMLPQQGLDPNDKAACIDAYNRHIEAVKAHVPADRLLVFRVEDGWEPLCKFLGCEPPAGVDFPHLNEGDQTLKEVVKDQFLKPGMAQYLALAAVIALAALLIW